MKVNKEPQLLILSLHRIGYPPADAKIRGLFTTPLLLKFQLNLLRKLGYSFKTLKDAMSRPQGKVAVVTFDDGYQDNLDALPILKQFNAPATVFVVTGDIGKKDVVWTEADEDLPADLMTWETLRGLRDKGWEIASHAHEHINLGRYGRKEQEVTIGRSITEIETNIGEVPVSFAYPYGSYNETTKHLLKGFGIRNAVTINQATYAETLGARDDLELGRVSIGGRNIDHFFKAAARTFKAAGSFHPAPLGLPSWRPAMQSSFLDLGGSWAADKQVVPGQISS